MSGPKIQMDSRVPTGRRTLTVSWDWRLKWTQCAESTLMAGSKPRIESRQMTIVRLRVEVRALFELDCNVLKLCSQRKDETVGCATSTKDDAGR